MRVEIVTTGSELLLGQIVNTNAAWLATELNKVGFDVLYQSTVGDNRVRMREVLQQALDRVDIVITSGGLGPTRGDITKEVSAELFGRELSLDAGCVERLKEIFARKQRVMAENNLRQAMIPAGAHILVNYDGTAPGIVLEQDGKMIINLPGPPSELKAMWEKTLKPYLREQVGFQAVTVSRVLNTFGIGESMLETQIMDLILAQSNPTLALLARPSCVLMRITAKAENEAAAEALIAPLEKELRARVGEYIFAVDDEPLEQIVVKELLAANCQVACAESCTGGLLTSRLTDVPGSSAVVKGAVVSYTNEVKATALGVQEETLAAYTAVSPQTAKEMAEGVRQRLGADIGISVTGIAGPGGGTPEQPVGLVYLALARDGETVVKKNLFGGTRSQVKFRASQTALEMLRLALQHKEGLQAILEEKQF